MLREIITAAWLGTKHNADFDATIGNFAAFVIAVQNHLAHYLQMEYLANVISAY